MGYPGYSWSLQPEGGKWRWRALHRDSGQVFLEGLAESRAEGAAHLARAMTLGVLGSVEAGAAA